LGDRCLPLFDTRRSGRSPAGGISFSVLAGRTVP